MAEGPLNPIRILDLTHVWAGPLATRILADLGADVVKIEAPYARGPREPVYDPIGGWITGSPGDEPWNRNAIFVKLSRNTRSLCLDLKTDSGHETFLELVKCADVVMENFSARVMPSLGLDYAVLKRANPSIIYVTMPGFGTYGPYKDRVAFGPSVEPMSGLTHVMGYSQDHPANTAMALMDPITALTATSAVLTALRRRSDTGEGACVEQSLHEGGVSYSGHWLVDHQLGGTHSPMGNKHPEMVPHGVYPCAGEDEWAAIACRTDDDWLALSRLLGDGVDASANLAERRAMQDQIDLAINRWIRKKSRHDAVEELQAVGVPAGSVNTTPDMTADPQIIHRGFFVPLEANATLVPGNPIKLNGASSQDWTPSPNLGADNTAVLKGWLNYADNQIEELVQTGVLADRPPG